MSSEMRQNKLTGQWVIYASERGDRPTQFGDGENGDGNVLPPVDPNCPFCPGNEDQLPEIILELPAHGVEKWQTRVVPNKYPMLTPAHDRERERRGMYVWMRGFGHHEVIIEHPRHDLDLADMPVDALETVIETYHRRYTQLIQQGSVPIVILFRNHGDQAGTSIKHPHSQLVAPGIVPQHIRRREDIAQQYYDTWGRGLMADILRHELEMQKRLVTENDTFVAFVPYAAEVPFEMWIVPRRQQAGFGEIAKSERAGLAKVLDDCLLRLRNALNNPDYNYVIHTSARYKAGEPHLHWYVQVRPRLVTPAGFEIGSGMLVNPSLPEDDAATLRGIATD
ncbi:MAG: galactose-1-phosphate uridylyltransferase [Chloroflexi bacterium]|nr:galactose-1-phosphate uridylyltransferase [Chloroflexota bacterium]